MSERTVTTWHCDRCNAQLIGNPRERRPHATFNAFLQAGNDISDVAIVWKDLCGECTRFVFECVRINPETGEAT